MEKGVATVMRLLDEEAVTVNGRSCWPEDAMEKPISTW
jgi:hypothetical protein